MTQVTASRPMRVLVGWILILAAFGCPDPASAHEVLNAAIQHRIRLAAGSEHVDLTIDLLFFEDWSARERAVMDADRNGRISASERFHYEEKLALALPDQVTLTCRNRELPLALLYDPKVELEGDERVAPSHHRLRIRFFATTPADLSAGDEFLVKDRLWADAPAITVVETEAHHGARLAKTPDASARTNVPLSMGAPIVSIQCLQPPKQPASTP